MNWFERHLNWSLFIAWIPLPFAVNLIILLILDLPPENQSSDNVRLDNKERGYFIGQKTIQIRANHQQAPRG
jgi:hypothetical protein